jgi:hypothetical protein
MDVNQAILVDTNIILEGHAKGCWIALAGHYRLETVETCVMETQTGKQRRRPEQQIDEAELRRQLKAVHEVSDRELATVLAAGGGGLDAGERSLWAHALHRDDAWILCGPDRASMKFGYDNRQRERLISMGELLAGINLRPQLAENYTKAWLDTEISKFALGVL